MTLPSNQQPSSPSEASQNFTAALSYRIHSGEEASSSHETTNLRACEEEWKDYLRLQNPNELQGNLEGCLHLKRPEDGWYALALVHTSLVARKLRVSVGLGIVHSETTTQSEELLAQSDPREAERLAQRALNTLEGHPGIAFSSNSPVLHDEFTLHTSMLNALCESTTLAAAEALRLRLLGLRQSEIASLLSISQVAVHKRLKKSSANSWLAVSQRYQAFLKPTARPSTWRLANQEPVAVPVEV
jgi:hypothetical protein